MSGNTKHNGQLTTDLQPSAVGGLSEKTIKKELRLNAIQHPTTLLPLTTSILSFIYLQFFSPSFGGSLGAIIVLISSGVVAAGSFLWRYAIRYPREYSKQLQERMKLQEQRQRENEQAELQQLQKDLKKGFASINLTEGLKALKELVYEYEQLQLVLHQKKETDYLFAADVQELADKTFRQGLSVLVNAVELGRVIRSTDRRGLEAEIKKLEKEMKVLGKHGNRADQMKIKQATVNSHKERLEMINQQQLQIDKLLYQCDRCEASLQRTRLELAALTTEGSETGVSAVTDTLRQTIDQAREVQEELRELGF